MAGFLNDMVGAGGCDGGGNAMAGGVDKMFRDMHTSLGAGPSMGQYGEEDQLAMMEQHNEWGAEFERQQNLHAEMQMRMPAPEGNWAEELMAQQQMPQAEGDWTEQFAQQQQIQPQQESWVEEFAQQEAQTFGVEGEEVMTIEQKQAACRSKDFAEMNRSRPAELDDWTQQFQDEQDADWASQFMTQYQGEEWAQQFLNEGALGGGAWEQEYSQASPDQYGFEEDNPYMYHDKPFEEGMELKAAGCLPQAALAFEAAVRKDETHGEAWKQLGLTQADNEKDDFAVPALLRAKALLPSDPALLMQLGVSLTNEGVRGQAVSSFKDWLAAHPVHGEVAKKAIAVCDTADGIAGLAGEQHGMIDYLKKEDDEARQAVKLFDTVLAQAPDPDIHAALGVLHHMLRNYDLAAEHYKAILKFPGKDQDYKLWNRLGAILANGGHNQEALAAYNRALDVNPGFVRAYYNIGIAYSQLERHDEAAKAYLKALEIQGSAGSKKVHTMGGMYIWDALRRTFSVMKRDDLYELTWKADPSLFASHHTAAGDPFFDDGEKY